MSRKESIAALLHELDQRSPAGFAIALHVRFTRPTYLFQTYAKPWMEHYSEAGLVMHDPVVRWGLQNVGRLRWSDLASIDEAGVFEQAKDYGLMNGAGIALVLSESRTIAAFARADRDYTDEELEELESLLARLHQATLGIERLSARDQRALTELSITLTH
ncbi:autoinducer binding domain-containing protein [Amaricoccus sp.]|uniref:autoinducer binding domain-containing protein n=1 Tax=Amaricoccus sp. TaxID=1872485 RepID=UPI00262AC11F|nr:autoinducer binding domain-containing protein [Amaricoccus sp.]HRO10823.1 autoinducer binding domain-containing protein [Amaricoccus sp.]